LNGRPFQFEWDETKAAANLRKHGVSVEIASTVFSDARSSPLPIWSTAKRKSVDFQLVWQTLARCFPSFTFGPSPIPSRGKFASFQHAKRLELKSATTRKIYE